MINGIEAPQTNDLKKPSQKKWPEQNWGIAAGLRLARIPFDTEDKGLGSGPGVKSALDSY